MTTRFLDRFNNLVGSDNVIEELFVRTCWALNLNASYQRGDGEKGMIASSLMRGPNAYAALILFREEGFDVALTTGVFERDSYAVVLIAA